MFDLPPEVNREFAAWKAQVAQQSNDARLRLWPQIQDRLQRPPRSRSRAVMAGVLVSAAVVAMGATPVGSHILSTVIQGQWFRIQPAVVPASQGNPGIPRIDLLSSTVFAQRAGYSTTGLSLGVPGAVMESQQATAIVWKTHTTYVYHATYQVPAHASVTLTAKHWPQLDGQPEIPFGYHVVHDPAVWYLANATGNVIKIPWQHAGGLIEITIGSQKKLPRSLQTQIVQHLDSPISQPQ